MFLLIGHAIYSVYLPAPGGRFPYIEGPPIKEKITMFREAYQTDEGKYWIAAEIDDTDHATLLHVHSEKTGALFIDSGADGFLDFALPSPASHESGKRNDVTSEDRDEYSRILDKLAGRLF